MGTTNIIQSWAHSKLDLGFVVGFHGRKIINDLTQPGPPKCCVLEGKWDSLFQGTKMLKYYSIWPAYFETLQMGVYNVYDILQCQAIRVNIFSLLSTGWFRMSSCFCVFFGGELSMYPKLVLFQR